jgi:hypothetical protein
VRRFFGLEFKGDYMFDKKEYNKTYYVDNKESEKNRQKIYYKNNKEDINNKNKIRRKGYNKKYIKTISGFTTKVWGSINSRTINGSHPALNNKQCQSYLNKGIRLEITREELKQKITEDWIKIDLMIKNNQRPSLDRIDLTKHYTLDNIQFITQSKNSSKNSEYIEFLAKNYNEFYVKTLNEFIKIK